MRALSTASFQSGQSECALNCGVTLMTQYAFRVHWRRSPFDCISVLLYARRASVDELEGRWHRPDQQRFARSQKNGRRRRRQARLNLAGSRRTQTPARAGLLCAAFWEFGGGRAQHAHRPVTLGGKTRRERSAGTLSAWGHARFLG